MQISTKYGFAFLSMPKCASTSVETVIKEFCNINYAGNPQLKHIDAPTYNEFILPVHNKLLPNVRIDSFCLMREPLEWIESWYHYRSRDELKNPNHPKHRYYTGNVSYQGFIEEFISVGKRKPIANLKSQFDFMSLNNDQIGLDYIIPMTRLDLVADYLSKKIGKKIRIPLKNRSSKTPTHLESSVEEKLRQYLFKDLAVYEFLMEYEKFDKTLHSDKLFAKLQAHQPVL